MRTPTLPSILLSLVLLSAQAGCGPKAPRSTAPAAGAIHQTADWGAFHDAGYHYCDAKLLSMTWGTSVDEAKARVGRAVRATNDEDIYSELKAARTAAREGAPGCTLADLGLTFDDAVAVANLWQEEPAVAKASLLYKAHYGDYERVNELVARARAGGPATEVDPDAAARRAFYDSPLVDYCHAKMLAAAWQTSTSEAKAILGWKVKSGSTALLSSALDSARGFVSDNPQHQCDWADTSFTWQDAELLAEMWNMTRTEAKNALAMKYTWGTEQQVREMLAAERGR